jgi:hypothetical protein
MPPKPKAAPVADDLHKLYYIAGTSHVTGRTPVPLAFEPGDDDHRPHAFVPKALGDHLIEADTDTSGRARYEWAKE